MGGGDDIITEIAWFTYDKRNGMPRFNRKNNGFSEIWT